MGGWVQWCLSFMIFIFKRPFFTLIFAFSDLHIFKLSIFTSSVFTTVIFAVLQFFTLKNPNLQSSKKTGTPRLCFPCKVDQIQGHANHWEEMALTSLYKKVFSTLQIVMLQWLLFFMTLLSSINITLVFCVMWQKKNCELHEK